MPAGGKGKLLLSWPFPDESKAQWLACVDLSTDSVWMFPIETARELAQQKHAGGTRLLYFYTDESVGPKALRQQRHDRPPASNRHRQPARRPAEGTAMTTDTRQRQKAALDRKIKACRECTT